MSKPAPGQPQLQKALPYQQFKRHFQRLYSLCHWVACVVLRGSCPQVRRPFLPGLVAVRLTSKHDFQAVGFFAGRYRALSAHPLLPVQSLWWGLTHRAARTQCRYSGCLCPTGRSPDVAVGESYPQKAITRQLIAARSLEVLCLGCLPLVAFSCFVRQDAAHFGPLGNLGFPRTLASIRKTESCANAFTTSQA